MSRAICKKLPGITMPIAILLVCTTSSHGQDSHTIKHADTTKSKPENSKQSTFGYMQDRPTVSNPGVGHMQDKIKTSVSNPGIGHMQDKIKTSVSNPGVGHMQDKIKTSVSNPKIGHMQDKIKTSRSNPGVGHMQDHGRY